MAIAFYPGIPQPEIHPEGNNKECRQRFILKSVQNPKHYKQLKCPSIGK